MNIFEGAYQSLSAILKRLQKDQPVLSGQYRNLTEKERELLIANGNIAQNWENVFVSGAFLPQKIQRNAFYGNIFLNTEDTIGSTNNISPGIFNSTIINSEIAGNALILHCSLIENYVIDRETSLINATVKACADTFFCLGEEVSIGNETLGRKLPINIFTLPQEYEKKLYKKTDEKYSFISYKKGYLSGSKIENSSIENSILFGNVSVKNYTVIENSIILAEKQKTVVSNTCVIKKSLVHFGCHIEDGSLVESSIFMPFVSAGRQAKVSNSILMPNTSVGSGEISCCFLGPFTASHHQSLLISVLWPTGRGNIGYGANVGSNHTSRAPDQELLAGEGMFFGLGSSIKFPGNFTKSPYSIIATGVIVPSQKLECPFSLLDSGDPNLGIKGNPNRILPGWVIGENFYALLRNEKKFLLRNKAEGLLENNTILREEIVLMVLPVLRKLRNLHGNLLYTADDIPEIGKNYLLEKDRISAIIWYEFTLQYFVCSKYEDQENPVIPGEILEDISLKRILRVQKKEQTKEFIRILEKAYFMAEESRKKDFYRGQKIDPGYLQSHEALDDDQVLADYRTYIDSKKKSG